MQLRAIAISHWHGNAGRCEVRRHKAGDAARLDPARQRIRLTLRARSGENHLVNLLPPQREQQFRRIRKDGEAMAIRLMLGFVVGVHGVKIGIAVQHRRVVGVDQRGDPRAWPRGAQHADQRRGEHQVANVVAANNEDALSRIVNLVRRAFTTRAARTAVHAGWAGGASDCASHRLNVSRARIACS